MFCLFFTEGKIWNVDDVKKANFEAFTKFFWGALDAGVYFAPSQYEAGFISLGHTSDDMEKTVEATRAGLKAVYS